MSKIINNEKLYGMYILMTKSLLIYTTIVLYYQYKGLDFTQIMLLSSISAIFAFLFEIPSGIISDRVKRKNVLVVSTTSALMGLIFIYLSNSFEMLLVASAFLGISEALRSGADSAFIYDHFASNNKEYEYKNYIATLYRNTFLATAVSVFFAGTLFYVNKELPVLISILFTIIALICNLLFIEERRDIGGKEKIEVIKELKIIFQVLKNIKLMKIIIMYVVMLFIISNLNFLSQGYLGENRIKLEYFGLIYLIFNLSSGIGSHIFKKMGNIKFEKIIFIYVIILILLFKSMSWWGIIFLIVSRIVTGAVWPSLDVEINKQIDKSNRATILSYKGLIVQLSFIFMDPLIGIIADLRSIHFVYLTMAIVIIVVFVVYKILNHSK